MHCITVPGKERFTSGALSLMNLPVLRLGIEQSTGLPHLWELKINILAMVEQREHPEPSIADMDCVGVFAVT